LIVGKKNIKNKKFNVLKSINTYAALLMFISAVLTWLSSESSNILKFSALLLLIASIIQVIVVMDAKKINT